MLSLWPGSNTIALSARLHLCICLSSACSTQPDDDPYGQEGCRRGDLSEGSDGLTGCAVHP